MLPEPWCRRSCSPVSCLLAIGTESEPIERVDLGHAPLKSRNTDLSSTDAFSEARYFLRLNVKMFGKRIKRSLLDASHLSLFDTSNCLRR